MNQKLNELNIFKDKKVLITGHTGFKGSWLSIWLSQLGAQVTGVSLDYQTIPSHFTAAKLKESLESQFFDIKDVQRLTKLIADVQPDFIFHLAAQALVRRSYSNPLETWHTNTIGTANLLESLRGYSKKVVVIMITSDKSYDNVEWVWGYRETDALGGADPYSASKGAAELVIKSFTKSFFPVDGNVRIGVGRAGNVIGGGDWADDRIVPDSIRASVLNQKVLLRNPIATRPWQHVLEPLSGYLTLAIKLAKSSKHHGEAFNFGPPPQQNHSVGELVNKMATYWGKIKWEDVSSGYGGPYESGLLKLNCDKALHYLSWQAVWDFDSTVRETVMWYRAYYENPKNSVKKFTEDQIAVYTQQAKEKGLPWAQ